MITQKQLTEWIHELGQYHTSPCHLVHEKIIEYIPADANHGFDQSYRRLGFCSKETRKWRLGCAHTQANDKYLKLLRELTLVYSLSLSNGLLKEIDHLILDIYKMDHHKGDIEKKIVLAANGDDKLDQYDLGNELQTIVDSHSEKIGRLEVLRLKVLDELQQIIYS